MIFNKDNSNNEIFLFFSVLIGILIIYFIYPKVVNTNNQEKFTLQKKILDILQDNKNEFITKIDKNICSKQCCKHIQWPVPFNLRNPIISDKTYNNFIPTNLTCNGGENGGCVCLTKNDFNYLANHGQN